MSSDTEKAIDEILNDFERQPLQSKRTFRSYLNQPELINISSANAQQQSPPISPMLYNQYYNFTVNLPRPALDAKSLQLLKAVIPQAQCSIPDYSLVFPYYRLRTVPIDNTGQVAFVDIASESSLFFVRLLPSYYKPENMAKSRPSDYRKYGYNRTFNDYQELVKEINKACKYDPLTTILSQPGDIGFQYLSNEITFYYDEEINKIIFRGLKANIPPEINTYPEWDPTVTYGIGDVVFNNLNFFQSLENDNIDIPPYINPTIWVNVTNLINGYTTWTFNQGYAINQVVQYNDIFYRCIKPVPLFDEDPPPTDPGSWEDVSQYFELNPSFNTYLIAGYQDKNVQTLLQNIETQLNTENYDYTTPLFTQIISIPGNQYVANQTLARRMGFTWDSTGMIYDSTINNYFENGLVFGGTEPLFYNRFRRIPAYYPSPEGIGLGLGPYTGSLDSYTADGYCNLVYSSVISIYTTIVGTSSVDTQRNANLIAMIEMNCANLGIAMVGNYIDTALTKIQGDIYSIYIELRDENGEPYYLTNNATTNFLLKLTYN